jgi:hypothetical protein
MLSLVVYGRNDSYGYNLHKRAALSLNCMAEVLDDPDDEILFVDYNTPDDYPTFPEAIQDTLTAKAKQRLRIFRVRPSIHARYRGRTHLATIEPVARNVAVRRSNPRNRWVLSTNTDMILVPRRNGSLSAVVADFADGVYITPRFGIPEALWEGFDRLDAQETIAAVRRWGIAAHLNEVVHTDAINLFDAPGDFQLIRRQDLFEIDGFNEGMLLGWQVDSNIAKRLHLLYGRTSSALDHVFGYHCDHTKQTTPMHRREQIENDYKVFVGAVKTPGLPQQTATWGCVDDEVEEIRLGVNGAGVYPAMLAHLLPSAIESTSNAYYTDNFWYDSRHVLPYVTDLIVTLPRSTSIAWTGVRRDMFALFAGAVDALGFREPLTVPRSVAERLGAGAGIRLLDPQEFVETSDLFFFELGLIRDESGHRRPRNRRVAPKMSNEETRALDAVRELFSSAVEHERQRLVMHQAAPRRFAVVNCIYNVFEPMVNRSIVVTLTSFTSRIRHGFVVPEVDVRTDTSVQAEIGSKTGLGRVFGGRELAAVRRLAGFIAARGELGVVDRAELSALARPLIAFLDHSASSELFADNLAGRELVQVLALAAARPHPTISRSAVRVMAENGGTAPLSKLASHADWNDQDFLRWTRVASDHADSAALLAHTPEVWRRAQVMRGLERLGMLDETHRAVVVSTHGERLMRILLEHVARVDVIDPRLLTRRWQPVLPRSESYWFSGEPYDSSKANVLRLPIFRSLGRGEYRIAVLMPGAAFGLGFLEIVKRIDYWLAPGAVLVLSDSLSIGSSERGDLLPLPALVGADCLPGMLSEETGLKPVDLMDPAISTHDASSVLIGAGASPTATPILSRLWWRQLLLASGRRREFEKLPTLGFEDENGAVNWPFVLFFRKTRETLATEWVAAAERLKGSGLS